MKYSLLTAAITAALLTSTSMATMAHESHAHPMPDHHCAHCTLNITPIGIMGDHIHEKGQFMMTYNFMHMDMDGMMDGTKSLSDAAILSIPNPNSPPANNRIIPTDMAMDMHMIGAMYGLTDSITATLMVPYSDKKMNNRVYNMAGATVIGNNHMESKGFGDVQIGGLFPIYTHDSQSLTGQLSFSLPTGSITKEGRMLMPSNMTMTMRSGYGMQMGTGTPDLLPNLTYTNHDGDLSYGATYKARLHMGRNDEGYTRGDWHELGGWAGYRLTDTIGLTSFVNAKTEDNISGQDRAITAASPAANPDYYGGDTINLGAQTSWKFYKNNTLKTMIEVPLYQKANGPQLENNYQFAIQWRTGF